jgi:hypothetical protein
VRQSESSLRHAKGERREGIPGGLTVDTRGKGASERGARERILAPAPCTLPPSLFLPPVPIAPYPQRGPRVPQSTVNCQLTLITTP